MQDNIKSTGNEPVFNRCNYLLILIACGMILLGFFLMAGEGSTNAHFNADIFSFRRIVLAPVVCFSGYILVIVGILWKKK